MAGDEIDAALKAFLRDMVHSYEVLELLLFCRLAETQALNPQIVADRLKIPKHAALEALEHLHQCALLERRLDGDDRTFHYRPATPDLARLVAALALAFENQPLALVRLMNENAVARVRSAAIHRFADSFVLSKKRGKDG